MGPKNSKDCSWGDPGILKMGPTTKSGLPRTNKLIFVGMNGVAMARHGLILSQDEATSLRKVFECLLDLWDAILNSIITAKVPKSQNSHISESSKGSE